MTIWQHRRKTICFKKPLLRICLISTMDSEILFSFLSILNFKSEIIRTFLPHSKISEEVIEDGILRKPIQHFPCEMDTVKCIQLNSIITIEQTILLKEYKH